MDKKEKKMTPFVMGHCRDAAEKLDACIFSDDMLAGAQGRDALSAYIKRWKKAIKTAESSSVSDLRDDVERLNKALDFAFNQLPVHGEARKHVTRLREDVL